MKFLLSSLTISLLCGILIIGGDKVAIIMTSKHQITIPKRIADVLGLKRGSMFEIEISKNRIELIPLETKEKVWTKEVYKKLETLAMREKGKEKRVTKKFIDNLKKGRS